MIQNGFVYAATKSIKQSRKAQAKKDVHMNKLRDVLNKHGVTLSESFSTANWTKTDKAIFEKGMTAAGYAWDIKNHQ